MDGRYEATQFHAGTRAVIFYLIAATLLLATVLVNQRNHSDAWILDGVLIPTLMFVFLFCTVETFIKGNRKIAVLTASFLVVISLVPGLKYQLFHNPYDSSFHFGFTRELGMVGHVVETLEAGPQTYYIRNPGMHVFMASLSIVSGIPINEIFRFVMPALLGLVPIIVFFVTNGVIPRSIQKYCILASAFPVSHGYIITGTGLTILLYFMFLAVFLRRVFSIEKRKEFTTIFLVLGFALIVSHAVSPLVAACLLIGLPLGLKVFRAISAKGIPRLSASAYVSSALIYLVMLTAWWTNIAVANLQFFAFYIQKVLSPTGFMELPAVPTRFYEVPLLAQLRVFLVFNILYVVVGALSLLGLLVFLRGLRRARLDNKTIDLYMHLLILSGIIVAYLAFMIGYGTAMLAYQRFITYLIPFGIFYAGFALWRFNAFLSKISSFKARKMAIASLLFVLVSFSLIQFFRCQPLIPRASVLSINLPEDEYLVDIHIINTVYQKEMISFAETHILEGRVASDIATGWQIEAFSNRSFQSRHIWGTPLEPDSDQRLEWDFLLLHTRKAGPFEEQVEHRTEEKLEALRTAAGNLIYDNGESFIISRVEGRAEGL